MHAGVLNELRILASTRFDSRSILSVVLAGDRRLLDKLHPRADRQNPVHVRPVQALESFSVTRRRQSDVGRVIRGDGCLHQDGCCQALLCTGALVRRRDGYL
jgi:hypothetical protein